MPQANTPIVTNIECSLPLLRLMQLASPVLPIGSYSYSQAQEKAVEDAWIRDAESLQEWLSGILSQCLARTDGPLLSRLCDAWAEDNRDRAAAWSRYLSACRETAELRQEDRQSGQALARLLSGLGVAEAECWQREPAATLACLFALAGVRWRIPKSALIAGYFWAWLENQVLCGVKLIPLGQVAGQQVLVRLSESVPAAVSTALSLADAEIGGSSPAQAIASSRHELQYSRLYRS